MSDRPKDLAQTFVRLADTLVNEFDLVEFLSMLTERCVDLMDASEVGVLISDPAGQLHVMATSSERMRMLELFEVQRDEGPCRDACRDGKQVINEPLSSTTKWGSFAPKAHDAGFEMVHAFPMRLRTQTIGAVNMFQDVARPFSQSEAEIAQALADAATIAILQERAGREKTELAEQLQRALNSRVVIEQAKGALAERLGIDTDQAFKALRSHARNNNKRLVDVALEITSGDLNDMSGWVVA